MGAVVRRIRPRMIRAAEMAAALLVGLLTFATVAAIGGDGPIAERLHRAAPWGVAAVCFMVGLLAALARILRRLPAAIALLWAVPIGWCLGGVASLALRLSFGSWGPPLVAAMAAAGAAVGFACVVIDRAGAKARGNSFEEVPLDGPS